MSDLENRLRRAGQQNPVDGPGPDLGAITGRGTARRRNKRLGAGIGAAAIVAVGAFGLSSRLDPPTRIEAATDGISSEAAETGETEETEDVQLSDLLLDAGYGNGICFSYDEADTGAGTLRFTVDEGRVSVVETRDRGGVADPGNVFRYDGIAIDSGTTVETTGLFEGEGDIEASEQDRIFSIDPDLSGAWNSDFDYGTVGCPEAEVTEGGATEGAAPAGTVDDGLGGSLTITDGQIVHLRADGTSVPIVLPDPGEGAIQQWVTDIASIDGVPYLFIDRFVNRDPVDTEVDFEVSILAVNLDTDEVVVVEQRRITEIASTDWTYNGHITTDGTNIIVMRELWQSYCLYAEGLTLDGQPVDVPQATAFPKPEGLDALTTADVERIQFSEPSSGAISPCLTLDDIPDDGVAALGRQADETRFTAFADAFYQAGLG